MPTPRTGVPPLHADLEPLAFLLGSWAGEGEGEHPGIEPFRYREELGVRSRRRPVPAADRVELDPRRRAAALRARDVASGRTREAGPRAGPSDRRCRGGGGNDRGYGPH